MDDSLDKKNEGRTRSKKKRGCFFGLLGIVLLILVIFSCGIGTLIYLLSSSIDRTNIIQEGSDDQIIVLDLSGLITETDSSSLFGSVSDIYVDNVLQQLDEIGEDPNVKALILNIESPGGEVVASDLIYRKVLSIKEKMPVIAYSGTMAASGGYYIASAADEFIVHPSALTGSIGVILQTSNMEGLYEKLGIETRTFKSGQFKDDADLYDEDDQGEIESIYQEIVDESYDLFIDAIVNGREMDEATLRTLADGRIYTGRQAVENGLADELGYLEDAVSRAKSLSGSSDPTVIKYEDWLWVDSFFGIKILGGVEEIDSIAPRMFGVYYLPRL